MKVMNSKTLLLILSILAVYIGLTYFGGDIGRKIMYPLRLFVTFLHEFGHAFGALITGGDVLGFVVNEDGSGVTTTRGGVRSIVIMGGYIGSAIFGNLLFYIGARKERFAQATLYSISILMIIIAFVWFSSLFTTGFLILFAIGLSLLARFTNLDQVILMFLGLSTILYIIQDFNIGPSSDLAAYADLFVIIPASVWMYIWLIIVVVLFALNIRMIFRRSKNKADITFGA